ncbi:aldo/keto reductase [Striga asiatica]|uniref:Aldo/keto reductase n=1 Tax=Striga asiatica TaxID=4170 RepID=A0A5A7PBM6_STRAF|nr:aldo/keto reductase [Striga asiatica]
MKLTPRDSRRNSQGTRLEGVDVRHPSLEERMPLQIQDARLGTPTERWFPLVGGIRIHPSLEVSPRQVNKGWHKHKGELMFEVSIAKYRTHPNPSPVLSLAFQPPHASPLRFSDLRPRLCLRLRPRSPASAFKDCLQPPPLTSASGLCLQPHPPTIQLN